MSGVAQTLIFIVCGSSAGGAMFLGNVLGMWPLFDEDALNGDRSVLRFFPGMNNDRANNRVHNVMFV